MKPKTHRIPGSLIKKIRKVNNLTQGRFGKLCNPSVTQATIARWESEEQHPTKAQYSIFASWLNISFEELMELIEQPQFNIDQVNIENKNLVYNKRHLLLLKKGAKSWNNWREKNPDVIPQLSGICLKEVNLDGYNLELANLAGFIGDSIQMNLANLSGANLEKAHLQSGSFKGTDFSEANCKNIKINGGCFDRAIFRDANLLGANILESDLHEATFEGACLKEADLNQVNFTGANLKRANLESAKLTEIQLREANCNDASLYKADLKNCWLYSSTFFGANFKGMRLNGIFVSAKGFEGLSLEASSLNLVFHRCLQFNEPLLTEKFVKLCQIEKEIAEYSQILVNKYGKYESKEQVTSFDSSKRTDLYPLIFKFVINNDSVVVKYIYEHLDENSSKKESFVKTLMIENSQITSNLGIEDLDIFRYLFDVVNKDQKPKFEKVISVAKKILESTNQNVFIGNKYFIEKINNEIIVSQIDNGLSWEIARGKEYRDDIELLRAYLCDLDILNLQSILLDILSSAQLVEFESFEEKLVDKNYQQEVETEENISPFLPGELTRISQELTKSQLAVYLYFKSKSPESLESQYFDIQSIAQELKISQRTVQRALVALSEKNLIVAEKSSKFIKSNY